MVILLPIVIFIVASGGRPTTSTKSLFFFDKPKLPGWLLRNGITICIHVCNKSYFFRLLVTVFVFCCTTIQTVIIDFPWPKMEGRKWGMRWFSQLHFTYFLTSMPLSVISWCNVSRNDDTMFVVLAEPYMRTSFMIF